MYIYDEKDIRYIDRQAVADGFSMYSLMENASNGLFQKVEPLLGIENSILILAGRGNNGGDGIGLARYLKQNGYKVRLTFPLGMPKTTVAKEHLNFYKKQGFAVEEWNENHTFDVIIDSMLGIGTKPPLRSTVKDLISWCNHTKGLKIAVDLPTGVIADHGLVEEAFYADYTFCLHGIKPAAFLLPSSQFFGRVKSVEIGLKQSSNMQILPENRVKQSLPDRGSATHKGTFGTSLLIAGSDEMPGSALLGAIGAIRTGTGKLTVATSKLAATIIATHVPEATFLFNGLEEMINGHIPEKVASIAIGPGIDDDQKVSLALMKLSEQNVPLVIDAGGLISLDQWKRNNRQAPMILTPHPGEFSRLTGKSVQDIQANRIETSQKFAKANQVTVVLKGKYTVIAYPDGEVLINPTGNNALAKGGSGDVLTGMILSMLATHENWKDAIANAVYIHGLCADEWSLKFSSSSMVASDFAKLLPSVLREIEVE